MYLLLSSIIQLFSTGQKLISKIVTLHSYAHIRQFLSYFRQLRYIITSIILINLQSNYAKLLCLRSAILRFKYCSEVALKRIGNGYSNGHFNGWLTAHRNY